MMTHQPAYAALGDEDAGDLAAKGVRLTRLWLEASENWPLSPRTLECSACMRAISSCPASA